MKEKGSIENELNVENAAYQSILPSLAMSFALVGGFASKRHAIAKQPDMK